MAIATMVAMRCRTRQGPPKVMEYAGALFALAAAGAIVWLITR